MANDQSQLSDKIVLASRNKIKLLSTEHKDRKILIAVTGASGSIYAQVLINFLLTQIGCRIYLIFSDIAKQVVNYELKTSDQEGNLKRIIAGKLNALEKEKIRVFSVHDLFAPTSSGTSAADTMILLPCSMGTVSKLAHGYSSNLIERSFDVAMKEHKQMLICPRETPLSILHLENLTKLAKFGCYIVPLMPAMYQKPDSVEQITYYSVGKICELIGFAHKFYKPWNHKRI